MSFSRIIRRYSSYYRGWCVAFGDHDLQYDENKDINWLFGDENIGFTLSPHLKRSVFHELLGRHSNPPLIRVRESEIILNEYRVPITREEDRRGMQRFKEFINTKEDIHLCLTSHFYYPPGIRIVTFTRKKPLIIMYKEIQPMKLEVL